jgi:hypothetical protein
MTFFFANPLWFLAALIAVPLLAHLFSKTRPRRREFPSLKLLREAMRRVTRVRRPRDRWLLLIRTLAMAALIGAFLQPWLLSRFASTGGVTKSVVVIVDVTASMGYADGTRTRLGQATSDAETLLSTLPTGSLANLIWIRAHAASELPEPGPNLDFLRQSLRQATARPEHGDITGALALAVKQLAGAPGERELVVYSDFQKSEWREINWQIPPGIRVTRMPIGSGDSANAGLAGLAVEPPRPVAGQDARLVCRVRNFSGDLRRATVFAEAGESRLSQAVEVAPWSETLAFLPVKFPQEGLVPVKASLAEDRFPGDDSAYALVEVRGPLQAGIAGPPDDATARIWLRAAHSLDSVAARRIEKLDQPGNLDVLFVAGWRGEAPAALQAHLARGGSLIIQPGEGLDPAAIRTLLALPAAPGSPLAAEAKDAPGWTLRLADEDHPAVALFKSNAYGDPANARFTRRIATPDWFKGRTLFAFEDNRPALTLLDSGAGKIVWWNLDLAATDWPTRSAFVPFFGELLRHLGSAQKPTLPRQFEAGEPLHFDAGASLDPGTVTLVNERDEPQKLVPTATNPAQLASAEDARPGAYRWLSQGSVLDRAAVLFPETESDLRRLSPEELQRTSGDIVSASERARLAELREGKPLWPWFLAAAAALFLLEGILLRIFPNQRDPLPAPARKTEKKKEAISA